MEPPALLRLARDADAGTIARMARELVEAGLTPRYSTARIARHIADRDTVTLVAEAADGRGGLQGFALMAFGEERAHLVLLAVRPDSRRRGIARGLLQWLLDSAGTAGMESVTLELRADNAPALAFYRALGFEPTLLLPGYYEGEVDARRMVRILRTPGQASATPLDLAWLRRQQ